MQKAASSKHRNGRGEMRGKNKRGQDLFNSSNADAMAFDKSSIYTSGAGLRMTLLADLKLKTVISALISSGTNSLISSRSFCSPGILTPQFASHLTEVRLDSLKYSQRIVLPTKYSKSRPRQAKIGFQSKTSSFIHLLRGRNYESGVSE